jgi:hypothetical protein
VSPYSPGDPLESLIRGERGRAIFRPSETPFFMMKARKSKIGIEPFKFFVRRLQSKVLERDIGRYFLYVVYGRMI